MTASNVGIVIIGRNEGGRLADCLRSAATSDAMIVYVDSGSTDNSCALAQNAGAEVVRLNSARPFTAARARNEGASALINCNPSIRFIQFVDGDCKIVDKWISTATSVLDSQIEVVAVCGRRYEQYPSRSVYNRLCDEEWDTPIGEALACGGDAMMRVESFAAVGGFDASMVAHEEPELCARLRARGGIILRTDAPMTYHDANIMQFTQWWRRSVRAGFGYAQALVRAPQTPVAEIALLRRALTWSLLPLPVAAAFFLKWPLIALALLALYPVQLVRLTLRERRLGYSLATKSAGLSLLGKFAETWGVMKFTMDRLLGHQRGAIFYR